jgi:hypothetical protein
LRKILREFLGFLNARKKKKKKKNSKPNQVGEKEKGEINQSLNYGDLALRIQTTPHVPPHLKL